MLPRILLLAFIKKKRARRKNTSGIGGGDKESNLGLEKKPVPCATAGILDSAATHSSEDRSLM